MQSTDRTECGTSEEQEFRVTSWEQYCELASRTESIPNVCFYNLSPSDVDKWTKATRLMHAAAGLVTETQELADGIISGNKINLIEELGDCFWYLPIFQSELNLSLQDNFIYSYNLDMSWLAQMQTDAAEILNLTLKRHVIYGKKLEIEKLKAVVIHYVEALSSYCVSQNLYIRDVCTANILKLKKRYPDGRFDLEATSNRNVENELSHISETNEFILNSDAPQIETLDEVFSGPTSKVIYTGDNFNDFIKQKFSSVDLEKLAMELCFNTAAYYRGINAINIARAYDSLYRDFSGKGCKLDDLSLFVMWRDLGYPLDGSGIVEKMIELGHGDIIGE